MIFEETCLFNRDLMGQSTSKSQFDGTREIDKVIKSLSLLVQIYGAQSRALHFKVCDTSGEAGLPF